MCGVEPNMTCKHCGEGYHLCFLVHEYDAEFCTTECWVNYNKEKGIEVDQECDCYICKMSKGEWSVEGDKFIWREKE
jgi:hypothetical protein